MKNNKLRQSGLKIMANLVLLLGNFAYFLIFAVINGVLGFVCAMGVTIFGSIGIAKYLGESISLSYELIISLTIICGVLRGLLRYIEQYSNHYIAFKLLAILRDKIFSALRILAPAKLEGKQKGGIIAMVTSDIETLEVFYAHTISPIMICIFVCLGIIIYVGLISSWYLSLCAFISYLIIGILIPLISSSKMKNIGVNYRQEFSSFNAYYMDSIKGVKEIVLHNDMDRRTNQVNKRSDSLLKETKKLKHYTSIFSSLTELIISLTILITLAVGILLTTNNILSIGKMIMGVVAIFGSFGPVIAISNLPGNLTQTLASGDRILKLLNEKPIVQEITDKNNFDFNTLEIKNLKFGYEENNLIINDLNFNAKKGEITCILGESGCGKSTLLKLLLRFYKKNSGSIKYNGLDIEDINTSSLLDNVTMVNQNTYLFDDTIENNLKIAKQDATMDEIISACKKASIHDFILSLENGYQTKVGTFIDNVSQGEKQRLGLARAFLKDSPVILLDEPTSNVDSINEGIILKSLVQQKKDKCIILVFHRESAIAISDHCYRFENGKLIKFTK